MASRDNTLKARLPRGLADRSAAEIRASEAMIARIRRVYERYGFEPIETPLFEYTEVLGKFLPDEERPNEGVFSFADEDGQWLSLRYDLTAPLARYVAENQQHLPTPHRSYRFGWVFRNEKPGPGRYRQFLQVDADTVGAATPAADAEMCMMAADTMEALGIARGQYAIKVSSRKVLDGVLEAIGVGDERQKLTVLRAIDKYDRLGMDGVRQLLGKGRKDESGDFTPGAGLSAVQTQAVIGALEGGDGGQRTAAGEAGAAELDAIAELAQAAGYDGRVVIDPAVVRGLEYYTGAVYEADLTFPIKDDDGRPVRFGSVGGGGRYDGLIGRFTGTDVPATGFSLGVSRLQAALAALGKIDTAAADGPVVVVVMERERIADYQKTVARLRAADIAAELYLGGSGLRAQMKYADRRNAPLAIIQGADERARGVVQIKDLKLGKELSAGVADHSQWREERPGQEEVAEADLVAAVNRLLGRGERRP